MSQIAKGLDIPVGTVKSNCRMALQTLSLLLHEQESDETIDELFRRADAAFYDTRKRRQPMRPFAPLDRQPGDPGSGFVYPWLPSG